mgnify:CR=1 FL=1
MQEDRIFENKYAPPVRSEKKIGNTTFTVNSFFLEQTKDGVVSKIERLIKDDVRKKCRCNLASIGRQTQQSAVE